MEIVTKIALIEAVRRGDLDYLRQLPDWQPEPDHEAPEDPWDFLNDFEDKVNGQEPWVTALLDARDYNLLDMLLEEVLRRMRNCEQPELLTATTLELIINKGARLSRSALRSLIKKEEFERLNRTELQAHCFRRTIGLFANACFGFLDFGEQSLLLTQKLATWSLYGIAYKINNAPEVTLAEVTPRGNRLHPLFLGYLDRKRDGCSELRHFIRRMTEDPVMKNGLIKNGHAWRMLNEINGTDYFEDEIKRLFSTTNEAPSVSSSHLFNHRPHTVLLAEDDPAQRLKQSGRLTRMGLKVLVAVDGQEALETFRKRQSDIDLVITDLLMPGLTGYELLKTIRLSDCQVPVILNTVPPQVDDPKLAQAVKELGNASLIPKHDPGLLKSEIQKFCLNSAVRYAQFLSEPP